MGPLGFALGLEAALSSPGCERAARGLEWLTWYLDDGTIVGPAAQVSQYPEALHPALLAVGLVVNTRKCLVWGPGVQQEGMDLHPSILTMPPTCAMRTVRTSLLASPPALRPWRSQWMSQAPATPLAK